jgi:hypothetical protein
MTAGDYSQNISGCIPTNPAQIKQEIDLLELCKDLNEDTFKPQPDKKPSVNKLEAAKL